MSRVDPLAAMERAVRANYSEYAIEVSNRQRKGIPYEMAEARAAVVELIEADKSFDACTSRKIKADNRVLGACSDDDYREQANAQHAYDRAVERRGAALARIAGERA